MVTLGIETSCDETAIALYDSNSSQIIAEKVYSQIDLHAAYGGVVPELASREMQAQVPRLHKLHANQFENKLFQQLFVKNCCHKEQ